MKFMDSFGATMAPVMQGKQVPFGVNGQFQQAQRLLGVPSSLAYYDAEVQLELTLLTAEYYGIMPQYAWDKYNWEAEALGQKMLVHGYSIPDIDTREPLIRTAADIEKLRWPTSNPLDAGRYPIELQLSDLAVKYYPYQVTNILCVSSFSLACNLCGGSQFLAMPLEEPEFCHALLTKITDDIHTPLVKAIAERFPGITVSFADAWEVLPNVSESIMREFAWAYYDRLKENTKNDKINLQWFVAYGEQYMKDPYAFLVEKAVKYSYMINDTNLEKCDPENYHRAAMDTGLMLTAYIPSSVIQEKDKNRVIEYVRNMAKRLRPGVQKFMWFLMCPATSTEYDIKAAIEIVKAFSSNPFSSPEDADKISVTLPEVQETFCDFVLRKAEENPDGYTFKWLDKSRFSPQG
jgi:hypothetical protein